MAQANNQNYLESILKRYRPENASKLPVDIQYLMDDKISLVLSEGFNVLYRTQPKRPIDFFAKWLLNYESTQKNKDTAHKTDAQTQETIRKYDQAAEIRRKQETEKEAQRQQNEKYENAFRDKLKNHEYHEELLSNELPSFIEKQKNLPAVYIGVLEHPTRAIGDDEEDENAHLDTVHQKIITYIGASGSQKWMVGRELQPGKEVTYAVFKTKEEDPAAVGQDQAQSSKPNYIYVPDVTKESKIFYFRIPRLGAYMAVPLSYRSVLSEKAFDAGVAERQRAQEAKAKQDKEKADRDVDYQEKIQEAKEAELDTKDLEDEWKNVEWPEITEKEFDAEERKFVLCLDTLGEDREISPEERKYIVELAQTFVNCWEESERKQLSKDIDLYLQIRKDVNKEEFLEELTNKLNDEITEKTAPKEGEEEQEEVEEESEAQQNYKKAVITVEYYKKVLMEDRVKNMIKALANYRVIKFKGLIQNIMYFLGYKKGQVNIPGTNVLEWKEIKKVLSKDNFFKKLEEYEYKGSKEGYWEKYALTNKLAQKLEKYNVDEIDEYNLGLGVLYRYVKQVLNTRLMDIELRRAQKAAERTHREEQIQKEKDWNTAREQELEELKNKATEEGQEFNQEEWETTWNEKNPPIVIPPEVIDDIDEDILE